MILNDLTKATMIERKKWRFPMTRNLIRVPVASW